jgi:hypothetical protein
VVDLIDLREGVLAVSVVAHLLRLNKIESCVIGSRLNICVVFGSVIYKLCLCFLLFHLNYSQTPLTFSLDLDASCQFLTEVFDASGAVLVH